MSGGVIAQQTNINSDQYFFVLANGQQINVSTLIATNGYFSTITGDTSFISSLISQNISTTSILATTAFISSLQSADISTNNLSVSTINNIGLSSFNLASWSEYKATNNIVGNSSNLINIISNSTGIYVPLVDISTINNATIANLQVKRNRNNTNNTFPTYSGGYINADNGISANSFSGNSASIGAIGCASLDAGNFITNLGVISAYGVNLTVGFNALYVQGGVTLDGGGTIHGITIGTQPVLGVNTMRIDVLPVGVNITSATYVTIDAGAAGNFACGGALSLAGGSYIELNTANINCIDTTYPGSCVLNVDNIFPSQNGRGNLNSFDLYNCVAPNFFNASNIITNQLSSCNINTCNLIINTSNNTSIGYNELYNYKTPSTFISSLTVNNSISNLQIFQYNLISNIIDYGNTTLQNLGGTNYYVFNALSASYFSNAFSNSIASLGGPPALVQFGTPTGVGYADFYNQGSSQPLYIEPDYSVSYTGFPAVAAGANKRIYFDPSFVPAGIRIFDLPSILYPSTFYSSVYSVDTFLTQNLSSATLTVDISGYDTNNVKYQSLGDFQINSSKFLTDTIYTNYISAGNIIGGFTGGLSTFSTLTTNILNANDISSSVLYAKNIYTETLGQPNAFIPTPILVNNGLNLQGNIIFNIASLSSYSIYANSISTNTLTVNTLENVSSISTNKLTVSYIENVSSLTANAIQASQVSSQTIFTSTINAKGWVSTATINASTSFFQTFVSTPTITTTTLNAYQLSNVYDTRIRFLQGIIPQTAGITNGTSSSYWGGTYSSNVYSVYNETVASKASTISVSSITSINANNTINIAGIISAPTIIVSSITGDGSQIYNLPAISSLSLQSTLRGLGTFGYISTSQITSTIDGLGTLGYVSSSQLTSTVRGLGQIYVSSIQGSIQSDITSSITGLGTIGYISSSQLTSTVRGLGQIYVSSIQGSIQSDITSSITGLGTIGYISSSQLTSTVKGLGNIYVSTPSLVSTIVGWAGIPANKDVNLYGYNIININNLQTDVISPSHSEFVLFDGNGIQTNNITSADFTQINFNNDISLEQRYSLKDALSLQITDGSNTIIMCNDAGDGTARFYTTQNSFFFTTSNGNSAVIQLDYKDICSTYLSNDISGYFHLSNTNNTLILEGLVQIDTITSYSNPNIIFQNSIDMSNNYISNVDYIGLYNGNSVGAINVGLLPYLNLSRSVINGNLIIIDTDYPILTFANLLSSGEIIYDSNFSFRFTRNIDMSNNDISNVGTLTIDTISPNSYAYVAIAPSIPLAVDIIQGNTSNPININDSIIFQGDISGYSDIDGVNTLTTANISTINISSSVIYAKSIYTEDLGQPNPYTPTSIRINNSLDIQNNNISNVNILSSASLFTSVITTQEIYTKNLGNNNPYAVQSIIVNNDFNMGQNNISNANTLTTSNISTINISTASLFTSSLTVSTINNSIFPLIQYGASGIGATVNLPKKYSSAGGYSIQLTFKGTGTQALTVQSNTTSNFYIAGTGSGTGSAYWMTIGI